MKPQTRERKAGLVMLAVLFTLCLLPESRIRAQQVCSPLGSGSYIEVTGEAEKELVPDQIDLRFTLRERYEGKDKTDLDKLEKQLKQLLQQNGFELQKLSLADAGADYITVRRKKKEVLQSRDYLFRVSTTGELSALWNLLEELDVQQAYIARVNHSHMEEHKREVRVNAVKNAREKARYLLEAAGEKMGRLLLLQERESHPPVLMTRNAKITAFGDALQESAPVEPEIAFRKLRLNYQVVTRFAIAVAPETGRLSSL